MSEHYYDPELPFLVELEGRVRALAEGASTAKVERTPSPGRPRLRSLRPRAVRMTRRTAILAFLLCLAGATAFGARVVLFSPSAERGSSMAPLLLARGRQADEAWTLRLYARDGVLCRALIVIAQEAASRCQPAPAPHGIEVTNLVSAHRRYLFGVAGRNVRSVAVRVGPISRVAPTFALPRSKSASAQRVAGSTRYYLLVLARPLGAPDPAAVVTGLDGARARVGDPHLGCAGELSSHC